MPHSDSDPPPSVRGPGAPAGPGPAVAFVLLRELQAPELHVLLQQFQDQLPRLLVVVVPQLCVPSNWLPSPLFLSFGVVLGLPFFFFVGVGRDSRNFKV